MPTPSHRPNNFTAKNVFTDRDEARELFAEQCYLAQSRDEYRVLNYFGIGGQGKSALCEQFELQLRVQQSQGNNRLAWAKINFEEVDKRQPVKALLVLRMQLSANGKIRFPAFDTAFARYFSQNQAGRSLVNNHPELFRQPHDVLLGLAEFTEGVGVPFIQKMVKVASNVDHKFDMDKWKQRRGAEFVQKINTYSEYELEKELPKYFGADIEDWLQENNAGDRRLVLLYDTYEALWRDRTNKTDSLIDAWVRRLVGDTPAVLHVILGREQLGWLEREVEEWQGIITPFPLDKLSDEDAEKYLLAVPILEADIRKQVVQTAKGIPFYLRLQVDQYEDCKRSGKIPQADDFGGDEPEILERFTSHLPDNLRRALVIAAAPQWLDENLFLKLCEQFLGGAASVRFADYTRYSFWTESEGRFYLHAVMRDYLQADSRERESELFKKVHQYLFEFYDGKLKPLESAREIESEHGEALGEGVYHLEQIDPGKVPRWLNKYSTMFHTAAEWTVLEPLLQQSIVICQQTGDKSGEGAMLNNISQIYGVRGDNNTALDYLEKSLLIRQEIGDKSGEGEVFNNISQIYDARGDYKTAMDYLEKSLVIRREVGDKSGEAAALNNIAQIYDARGDYTKSLDYLEKSLLICQEIGEKYGEATTLNNISQIYKARGDNAKALEYLEKSLLIYKEIGSKSGEAVTLNNISQIFDASGDYEAALEYLEKALLIYQRSGEKSGEGLTLNNISLIYKARGDYKTALIYLEKSLVISQGTGEKSREGTILNNISQIYITRDDYKTALDYLGKSLLIHQEIGDPKGLCTALFNMGHIHWQNDEQAEAMPLWLKVYRIASSINLAQPLDALEKLAKDIGLPNGLASWEELSQKMGEEDEYN